MAIEIEKKFLLKNDSWKALAKGIIYRQGYLNSEKGRTVRVRTAAQHGYLTIKGPTIDGVRLEYEYEIPYDDARELLEKLCTHPLIEKRRYAIPYQGFTWEVDEFFEENKGLVVAEIELDHPSQEFSIPPWIGREVTGDPRYFNSNLARKPYITWDEFPC